MSDDNNQQKLNGKTQIHNVKFYNLSPRGINCLAYNKNSCKIALSRTDSSIEIWDLSYAPFHEKTIPTDSRHSIEGICWSEDRLFSTGLSGEVNEWDLSTLTKKQSQNVTGNASWCLDINHSNTNLAIGTEQGYLNIFDITLNSLQYLKIYDKQDGRILCCKFNVTDEFLITGSLDVIRIWNTKTGHAIQKMTTSRSLPDKETIIWSIQVLKDFTIISGDSRGYVTIWDGKIGVQIESHQALLADVLTVTVNDDEDMLICGGVEPIIRIFALTTIKKTDYITKKWVKFIQRKVHDHDVKSLICVDGHRIISGGIDGYLGVCSYLKSHYTIKIGPFLQTPCANLAENARLLLLRYLNYIEIWKMGLSENNNNVTKQQEESNEILKLQNEPMKILALRSKNNESILCSVISSNGKWLIYSTKSCTRLFSIEYNEEFQPKLNRIKDFPMNLPVIRVLFSSDSKFLYLFKYNNQIDVFSISGNNDIDLIECIDASKYIKDVIHLVDISKNNKYLAIGGTCRTISIWIKTASNKCWKYYLTLPKYLVPTTAFALHPNAPRIVATFTDGKTFEYDLDEMRFTCSNIGDKDKNHRSTKHHIKNILFDTRNDNIYILSTDTKIVVLKKTNSIENSSDPANDNADMKKLKIQENSEIVPTFEKTFRKYYEHLVHLEWLSKSEMVAINVNPIALIEELPDALKLKVFGAM